MSFEAYKVAVKLSLVNNVSAGLVSLTSQFMSMNKHVTAANAGLAAMETKLAGIKRLGLIGGAMAAAGTGMLLSLKGPIGQAMEWEREAAKMRQMGLGDLQIRDAQKFVQATDIIGTSMQQRMKLFVEAQGAFRESGMTGSHALEAAKVMTPALAGYELAVKTLNGDKKTSAENSMISLNRLVEQMGGLNDSKRAASIVDMAFRSVQASGKMITPDQLRQFRAYGGSAVANYSDLAIFAGLEPIMGELKGSTTGMGLRTAYNRMQGLIKPPNQLLSETERLGIWDSSKYTKNSMGGIKTMNGNPLNAKLANLMNSDPVAFAKEMMGIYAAHGITSATERSRENALLFGSNGAKVYDLIMRQMPTLERSIDAFNKSKGIDETNKREADSPMMAIEKFHSALSDLGLVIGQTVLPVLTPMITALSGFFKGLKEYPGLVKVLTIGFVGLAAAMAIGGTLALTTAGFKALGLAMTLGKAGTVAGSLSATAVGLKAVGLAAAAFLAIYAGYKIGEYAGNKIDERIQKGSGYRVSSLRDWLDQTSFGQATGWFKYGQNEAMHFQQAPSSSLNNSGSRFVSGKIGQPAQGGGDVYLDREKVGKVLWNDMDKELRRPMAGTSRPDGRMSMTPVGASGRG